ncbi:hypothetical protein F511_09652 [Dorcoceras hygrometricum]|uniref:Uncharacterized protein n=1 Tax=Dorcoceras hygrometricum TaxID=472368 RepID=A0A2Z7AIB1_9LAMI|nr:hypothetical protein F511_09652 [Dorcoceras hygrometricum]
MVVARACACGGLGRAPPLAAVAWPEFRFRFRLDSEKFNKLDTIMANHIDQIRETLALIPQLGIRIRPPVTQRKNNKQRTRDEARPHARGGREGRRTRRRRGGRSSRFLISTEKFNKLDTIMANHIDQIRETLALIPQLGIRIRPPLLSVLGFDPMSLWGLVVFLVVLFSGNPGFTAGRGFNPAGGVPEDG